MRSRARGTLTGSSFALPCFRSGLLIVSVLDVVGRGDSYAPGEHAYDPHWSFEENDITHSRVRFEMRRRVIADNPGVALGGPTNRWVRETIRATREARAGAGQLTVPVLLLQAGDDLLVTPWGQEQFMQKAPACRRLAFPGASHELLMETDSIRDAVLREIRSFLLETAPKREP
jgi:lysophospholipase